VGKRTVTFRDVIAALHTELTRCWFQVGVLEFTHYLERFLWPGFDPETASVEHVLSIVLMVNEKLREQTPGWGAFEGAPEQFPAFFRRVRQVCLSTDKEVCFAPRLS
jgi:hypothetical protein